MGFLYQLLAQRPSYTSISHGIMPSWEQHCEFWTRPLYREQAIIMLDEKQAGYYYISKQNELGIHLVRACRGHGIGPAVIKHLVRKYEGETLLANVAPCNECSQRLFEGMGWQLIQQTYRTP